MTPALYTSNSDCWLTPPEFVDLLDKFVDGELLDPFAHPLGIVPADQACTGPAHCGKDGLTTAWLPESKGTVFVQPPYGRFMRDCADKIRRSRSSEIIGLVPARTDTEWWQSMDPTCWLAWKGRLSFLEPTEDWEARECRRATKRGELPRPTPPEEFPGLVRTDPATFPSAVLYFGRRAQRFARIFGAMGRLYCDGNAILRHPAVQEGVADHFLLEV